MDEIDDWSNGKKSVVGEAIDKAKDLWNRTTGRHGPEKYDQYVVHGVCLTLPALVLVQPSLRMYCTCISSHHTHTIRFITITWGSEMDDG